MCKGTLLGLLGQSVFIGNVRRRLARELLVHLFKNAIYIEYV